MTGHEFWLIYEGKQPPKMVGTSGMTEAEVDSLLELLHENRNADC